MIRNSKRDLLLFAALLLATAALAQSQTQKELLSVQGCPGKVTVLHLQDRMFVDAQDLAQITNGSLSLEGGRLILTLPRCHSAEPDGDASKSAFSRTFMRAAIEAMASIREWGGALRMAVQNGYPVGNTMVGNTIAMCQGRADDSVALASAAATTDADNRGVELLRSEFNNVQAWADKFIKARNDMNAVDLTTSEDPLKNDQEAQKIVHCGQFLAQMFAGGAFRDEAACH